MDARLAWSLPRSRRSPPPSRHRYASSSGLASGVPRDLLRGTNQGAIRASIQPTSAVGRVSISARSSGERCVANTVAILASRSAGEAAHGPRAGAWLLDRS
jgi:hypothetical protein